MHTRILPHTHTHTFTWNHKAWHLSRWQGHRAWPDAITKQLYVARRVHKRKLKNIWAQLHRTSCWCMRAAQQDHRTSSQPLVVVFFFWSVSLLIKKKKYFSKAFWRVSEAQRKHTSLCYLERVCVCQECSTSMKLEWSASESFVVVPCSLFFYFK